MQVVRHQVEEERLVRGQRDSQRLGRERRGSACRARRRGCASARPCRPGDPRSCRRPRPRAGPSRPPSLSGTVTSLAFGRWARTKLALVEESSAANDSLGSSSWARSSVSASSRLRASSVLPEMRYGPAKATRALRSGVMVMPVDGQVDLAALERRDQLREGDLDEAHLHVHVGGQRLHQLDLESHELLLAVAHRQWGNVRGWCRRAARPSSGCAGRSRARRRGARSRRARAEPGQGGQRARQYGSTEWGREVLKRKVLLDVGASSYAMRGARVPHGEGRADERSLDLPARVMLREMFDRLAGPRLTGLYLLPVGLLRDSLGGSRPDVPDLEPEQVVPTDSGLRRGFIRNEQETLCRQSFLQRDGRRTA